MGYIRVKAQQTRIIISKVEKGLYATRFEPVLDDQSLVSDAPALTVEKGLADTSSASELYSGSFQQSPRTDAASAVEQATLAFLSNLSDSLTLSDGEVTAVEKALADSGVIDEDEALDVIKSLSELLSIADDDVAFNLVKGLSDLPQVADSAVTAYIKSLADSLSVDDPLSMEVDRGFSEITQIAEAFSTDIQKPFANNSSASDDDTISFAKNVSEQLQIADVLAKVTAFARSLSDGSTASDRRLKSFGKVFTNSVGVSEVIQVVRKLFQVFADSVNILDVESLLLTKNIVDTLALSEDLKFSITNTRQDLLAINELAALSLQASADDSITVSDIIEILRALGRVDAVAISDSGSLLSQSYADRTYFLQDYVGQSATF
jgi:hypothetical protein